MAGSTSVAGAKLVRFNGGEEEQAAWPASAYRLLQTATAMFNRYGIHATGIDQILAEAGVARMILYKHFGSKSGLVHEVLRRESLAWFERLDRAMAKAGPKVADRISVYFDVLADWADEPDFKGCCFMNAVGESAFDDAAIRPIASAHRRASVAYVQRLLGTGEEALADTIVMIANGATVDVMVTGNPKIVERARNAALSLIAIAPAKPRKTR